MLILSYNNLLST